MKYWIVLLLLALSPLSAAGQSTITFQVDMSSQIADSSFIPTNHSLQLSGNQLPLSKTRTIQLKAAKNNDSLYTATVRFPSIVENRELTYRYLIRKGSQKTEELNSRTVRILRKDQTLPIAIFNGFEM